MKCFVKELTRKGVTLTAYIHDRSDELSNAAKRPAVLVFPGGGYFMCSDREGEPVALSYAAEGYQAFVLRYSTGQDVPFEDSFADAVEALYYIREQREELAVDIERIAVAGFSAGGHLAAVLGTMGEVKPSAMILGYPVTLDEMGRDIKKDLPSAPEHVTKKTPPTYIFTTCTDELVPVRNSLKMAEALDREGIPFEMHIFPDGAHGLSLAKAVTSSGKPSMVNARVQQWFQESMDFLKKVWGDFETNNETLDLGMDQHTIGINMPLNILIEKEGCRQILTAHIPGLEQMLEANPSASIYSLRVMNKFSPEIITDEMLASMEQELEKYKSE